MTADLILDPASAIAVSRCLLADVMATVRDSMGVER